VDLDRGNCSLEPIKLCQSPACDLFSELQPPTKSKTCSTIHLKKSFETFEHLCGNNSRWLALLPHDVRAPYRILESLKGRYWGLIKAVTNNNGAQRWQLLCQLLLLKVRICLTYVTLRSSSLFPLPLQIKLFCSKKFISWTHTRHTWAAALANSN
jgi:hypothetical protein